jgi:hypothetical protein
MRLCRVPSVGRAWWHRLPARRLRGLQRADLPLPISPDSADNAQAARWHPIDRYRQSACSYQPCKTVASFELAHFLWELLYERPRLSGRSTNPVRKRLQFRQRRLLE